MVSILSSSLFPFILILSNVHSAPFLDGCNSTSWYSLADGGYPKERMVQYPVTEVFCRKEYCSERKDTQCSRISNGDKVLDLKAFKCAELTQSFSEDNTGLNFLHICPDGMFVGAIKCDLGRCDWNKLNCCEASTWKPGATQVVTPWFSAETSQQCPPMHVVTGAGCFAWDCQSMRLVCAPVKANEKVGQSYGSWVPICRANTPCQLCQHSKKESVTCDRQPYWDSKFAAEVNESITKSVTFGCRSIQLSKDNLDDVRALLALQKDTVRSCQKNIPQADCNGRNSTDFVWWQWVIDVDENSIADSDQIHNQLHVATCNFQKTSSFVKQPNCIPGTCADQDCQTCKNTSKPDGKWVWVNDTKRSITDLDQMYN